ncbi:hypothetical protein BDR26DRAFT_193576 [Obelidium mucronatum]|nr:hypothetical protein BDR26DRAFT_193576 [Obelidium mucronatum]
MSAPIPTASELYARIVFMETHIQTMLEMVAELEAKRDARRQKTQSRSEGSHPSQQQTNGIPHEEEYDDDDTVGLAGTSPLSDIEYFDFDRQDLESMGFRKRIDLNKAPIASQPESNVLKNRKTNHTEESFSRSSQSLQGEASHRGDSIAGTERHALCQYFQRGICEAKGPCQKHLCMICGSANHGACDCSRPSSLDATQKYCRDWNCAECDVWPCSFYHKCLRCNSRSHGALDCTLEYCNNL